MKRFFVAFLFFLTTVFSTNAQTSLPITSCISNAELVCLVRVTTCDHKKVTFKVTESLRGTVSSPLTLTIREIPWDYPKDSEWLLVSSGKIERTSYRAEVGWWGGENGGSDWLPAPVFRADGKSYVSWFVYPSDHLTLETTSDGKKGLKMEIIKQLLQDHPFKS